jgi:hypothetical protein
LLLSLACCSGRTRVSLGGTPTSVMVHLLSPIVKQYKPNVLLKKK